MKILHLSFHYGCISDLDTVFKTLGHEVVHQFNKRKIPYTISEQLAHQLWNQHKNYYNEFDIIITSDTVALYKIFQMKLNEIKTH